MKSVTNNINDFAPKKGETIACDVFGTGNFRDYKLRRVTRNCFWARRERKSECISLRCNFGRRKSAYEFWRGGDGVLHYQPIRDWK